MTVITGFEKMFTYDFILTVVKLSITG